MASSHPTTIQTACLLDEKLSSPALPQQLRRLIASSIFSIDLSKEEYPHIVQGLDAYFLQWFLPQCQGCAPKISPVLDTYDGILNAIAILKKDGTSSESFVAKLGSSLSSSEDPANDEALEACMILAARLVCMLSIGHVKNFVPPGTVLEWSGSPECTIKDHVNAQFTTSFEEVDVKLPRLFNAMNLERIAGIEICWSSNLADHLMMKEDDTVVTIFYHAAFLKVQAMSPDSLLDPELVEETLRTLALLFPERDNKVKKWFAKAQKNNGLDPLARRCGQLNKRSRNIEKFKFWRDRITILKQAFDESEPKTISGLWNDDRKKVQWFTFWIAALILLLTIVFGFIQCSTAIIQAWASVKALKASG